jgi:hypothetical protein
MNAITLLWHPDSPGMRVPVRRSWLGRLFKPVEFATVGEVLTYYRALELVQCERTPTPAPQHSQNKESGNG